jgi:hypothetical protein
MSMWTSVSVGLGVKVLAGAGAEVVQVVFQTTERAAASAAMTKSVSATPMPRQSIRSLRSCRSMPEGMVSKSVEERRRRLSRRAAAVALWRWIAAYSLSPRPFAGRGQGRGARCAWRRRRVRLRDGADRRIERFTKWHAARPSPLPSPRGTGERE